MCSADFPVLGVLDARGEYIADWGLRELRLKLRRKWKKKLVVSVLFNIFGM